VTPKALTASAIATLLLATTGLATDGDPDRHTQGLVYWTTTQVSRAGGPIQAVDEALLAESIRNFDTVSEIYAPSAARATAGRTFGALGRVTDWASIAGSYSGGDEVGMANHATNGWLSGIATSVGVTIGVAVASVAGVPLLVGGVAGALTGAVVYGNTAKVGVDSVFEDMAQAQIKARDRANRIRMARVWVAQADYLCLEARSWLTATRAGLAEVEAAKASAEWADDLLATARLDYGSADDRCNRLEESADPDTLASELDARLSELDALVKKADEYAGETCRMKSQMSQTSQPDAARIWNNEGQYLNGRTGSTAADARKRAQAIREQADIIHELNRLRRAAREEARAAQARLDEAATHVQGASERIVPAAAVVKMSQRRLPDIQAAVEDCDRKRNKAADILEAYERDPTVQMIATQEVYSIDPPFAELAEVRNGLESGLGAIETARAHADRAGAQLEVWRTRLAECAARATPSGAAEATAARADGMDARLAELARIEARSRQCAQEAEVLATGPGGWGEGDVTDVGGEAASGGWGEGSARDVVDTSHLVEAAIGEAERCHYTLAVTHVDEILRKDPANAWALVKRPEVAAWVSKAGLSRVSLNDANQQLLAGDVRSAFGSLATARSNAPPCDADRIDGIWKRVKKEAERQEAVARVQAERDRQVAEQDRQARERERRESDRRNREAMTDLARSLGDLLSTMRRGDGGGGGSGPSTPPGGGTTSRSKSCAIIHESHGSDSHFLLEFPPNQPSAPVGYLIASVPAWITSGSQTICSSARACLGHLVPYQREGARIVGQYGSRSAAEAEARKRCPDPAYGQ